MSIESLHVLSRMLADAVSGTRAGNARQRRRPRDEGAGPGAMRGSIDCCVALNELRETSNKLLCRL